MLQVRSQATCLSARSPLPVPAPRRCAGPRFGRQNLPGSPNSPGTGHSSATRTGTGERSKVIHPVPGAPCGEPHRYLDQEDPNLVGLDCEDKHIHRNRRPGPSDHTGEVRLALTSVFTSPSDLNPTCTHTVLPRSSWVQYKAPHANPARRQKKCLPVNMPPCAQHAPEGLPLLSTLSLLRSAGI
jgi:hypothetical protein